MSWSTTRRVNEHEASLEAWWRTTSLPFSSEFVGPSRLAELASERQARLKAQMRTAVLFSKKTIDSMRKSNRDELFQSAGISEKEKQAQMGNEKLG